MNRAICRRLAWLGAVACMAGLTFAFPSSAGAQVRQIQTGNALDVNPMVGGGGANAQTPSSSNALNSQLYITGQVTGLGRFHGYVGYSGNDELQSYSSTGTVGTFRQQSVGVSDVMRGGTYSASPYYDRSRTVFDVAKIVAGDTIAGSSASAQSAVPATYVNRLYSEVTTEFQPQATTTGGMRYQIARDGTSVAGQPATDVSAITVPTGAFDIARAAATYEKAMDKSYTGSQETADQQGDSAIDAAVDTQVQADVAAAVPSVTEPVTASVRGDSALDMGGYSFQSGRDVFLDMLVRLREQQTGQRVNTGEKPADGSQAEQKNSPNAPTAEEGQEPSLVEASATGPIIVHSFAGKVPSAFNAHLAAGERKLKEGKFYEAAGSYEVAMMTKPTNPLPRFGLMLSLLSAGESYAAAVHLRQGMALLPPMMQMKLDLVQMSGPQYVVIQKRLAEIETQIKASPGKADPALIFLAAYLCQQSGRQDDAKTYCSLMLNRIKETDVMASYARWVLTGKPGLPAKAATSRPASLPAR